MNLKNKSRAVFCALVTAACGALARPIDLICIAEFPSTSFKISEADDRVIVEVYNHNGPQFMPIWEGLVVPNDLDKLKKAAGAMIKLGDYFKVIFKKAACESDDLLSCTGQAEDFVIAGSKFHPWALTQSRKTEEISWYTFKQTGLVLNLDVDGESYRLAMNYGPNECFTQKSISAAQLKSLKLVTGH